ncbi:MAG: chorismate-binding protein [Bdellovibrionota bacterium]
MSESLSHLIASEARLCLLREPNEPLRLFSAGSGGGEISFRKFHQPREKSPSAWNAFDGGAHWESSPAREIAAHEIPAIARPAAALESSREEWNLLCAACDRSLSAGTAQKLVPAREVSARLTPGEYERLLQSVGDRLFFPQMRNATRFLLKSRGSVFFGATPERLFLREGGRIFVPAIAGTRALTAGYSEAALGEELLASEKDRREHGWVVSGILEALRGLGLDPSAPPQPEVLKVPGLLHLHTPIFAADEARLSSETLIRALHPTPAIGGHPRAAAADFLFQEERWDRGLFSAPLLFRFGKRELCLVAIRSALLTPERLHFFAGAGYVKGSTAEAEWHETDRKLKVMQTALFGEAHDG